MRWWALLVVALVARMAAAAPPPPGRVSFRSFGVDDGLTNLDVLAVVEDPDGATWVGTDDGLFRLDGERFVRIGQAAGLRSWHVNAIAIAPGGELCIGTALELACGRDGRFTSVPIAGGVPALASTTDALWIATTHGLLVRRGDAAPAAAVGGPSEGVSILWADGGGVIAGAGAHLAALAPGGTWQPLELDLGPGADPIRELLRDETGTLWLRSVAHVWRLAAGQRQARDVTFGLPPSADFFFGAGIARSPKGEVVLATEAGVATLVGDHWDVLGRARGLPSNGASLVHYDHDGDLWVGSIGLHRRLGRGLVERHSATTGLPGDAAWAIARDAAGALLVGTDHCLVEVGATGWACVPGTEGHFVRAIAAMPDGGVYFGGGPSVLLHRGPDGVITTVKPLSHDPTVAQILAITVGGDGTLWIGGDDGLWRRPPGAATAVVQEAPPGGDPSRFVSGIVSDGPRVWFAGEQGLRMFDGATWSRFTERDGLRATAVRYVMRRHDGRLCVVYDEALGVSCFRFAAGSLTEVHHLDAGAGLDTTMVYALGEDGDGRLWLGTGIGVRVISDQRAVPIDRFSTRDGLAGDDSSAMAFLADADGTIWLGEAGGLSRIAGADYHGPAAPPPVRLITVERDADGGLHATFVANNHDDAGTEYAVRLRPREDAWTTIVGREVRYPEPPPGTYALERRARVRGGAWGPVATAPFVIPPAWWQAPWVWLVGGIVGIVGLAALILGWQRATLRRRTRQLLAQTDASFRAFIASLPDVVVVLRADGVVYFNQAARALLGGDATAAARWLLRRVHPDDRRAAAALLRGRPSVATGALVELRVLASDGWRDLEVSRQAIELAGAPARVLVGRDVTERRRLHAKMLIADRMVSLGTLAGGIAHEINNPLAYVLGNLEVLGELLEGASLDGLGDDVRAAMSDALEGAERVKVIVRGLASFNRGREELLLEVDLGVVIEQAVQLTHNELRHRAQLVLALGEIPTVLADPGRLTQVVINLLVNAAHAIAPGAADRHQITIRTGTTADGGARLEVEDTGAGMPPEVVARAFDPFFTTKQIGEGTGLGLSICHGIVTNLGGQITVDSTVGHGTTVRITLPASPAAAIAPPRPPPVTAAPVAAERPRVLVIDDDPAVGTVLARLLRADCDVTVVTGGADALRRLAAGERFDVLITDVMMPVMTGLELRDRLLATQPDQARRIVFITGGAFTAATAARLEQLDVPRLAKPVDADELRRAVRAMAAA